MSHPALGSHSNGHRVEVRPEPGKRDALYRRAFVGRERELGRLLDAFDQAAAGRGAIVAVGGEPGAGKTALCERFGEHVAWCGGRVFRGGCYEEPALALPYLPFATALCGLTEERNATEFAREHPAEAAYLARVVPRLPDPGTPSTSLTLEEDRWQLREAVCRFITRAAGSQPLVLILEDLHWADSPTVALLGHLARRVAESRLVVVVTYRDVELDSSGTFARLLGDLGREPAFARIELQCFERDEVRALMQEMLGSPIEPGLAAQVYGQTAGNALFVQELVRWLADEPAIEADGWSPATVASLLQAPLPGGLLGAVARRVSAVSPDCRTVLTGASVLGREFAVDVVARVVDVPEERLFSALEEALARGLIEEQHRNTGPAYRFSHALVQKALYETILAPRRGRLHRAAAIALEQAYADCLDDHAAELAEHFACSPERADLHKAISYAEQAANAASAVFDYPEAVRLLDRAVGILEEAAPRNRERRCGLLLARGSALLAANEPARLDADAEEAFRLACDLGDGDRAARAARLGAFAQSLVNSAVVITQPRAQVWVRRLDEYARAGTATRAMANTLLAAMPGTPPARKSELRLQGLQAARESGDPDTVRWAASVLLGSEPLTPVEAGELVRLVNATAGGHLGNLAAALFYSGQRLCSECLRNEGEREYRRVIDLVARAPDWVTDSFALQAEATLACLDGRLEEAVEAALDRPGAVRALPLRTVVMRPYLYLGRAGEFIDRYLADGVPRRWYALAFVAAGDHDRARSLLAERPSTWLLEGELNALEAAIALGEEQTVAECVASIGSAPRRPATGSAWFTIPDRHLAAGYAFLGDAQRALAANRSALATASRMRFRPEIALVRLQLAELLLAEFPGCRDEVEGHLAAAMPEFEAMAMAPALARARALAATLAPVQPVRPTYPEGLSAREVEVLRLVAAGLTNQRIAETLALSQHTVVRHISHIFRKAGVDNRAGAAAFALRRGLLR